MFDTIVFICWLALMPQADGERWCPPGWTRTDFSQDAQAGNFSYDFKLENRLFGIRVFGRKGIIQKVEVDLPKLLYGHNGRLLVSQQEIDEALHRLKLILSTICTPHGVTSGFFPGDQKDDFHSFFTRIDATWQFNIEPSKLLLALRYAKHPEINKTTGRYEGETLTFPGTKLHITAYDKLAKMRVRHESYAMRIEVRFEDNKIAEYFDLPDGGGLTHLDIVVGYKAYRRALMKFQFLPLPLTAEKGTIEDFLAWVAVRIPDEDPIGMYCATKQMCQRKARDLRKEVGKRVPALVSFSWADLLPEHHLPVPVHVPYPSKESKILNALKILNIF